MGDSHDAAIFATGIVIGFLLGMAVKFFKTTPTPVTEDRTHLQRDNEFDWESDPLNPKN